MAWHRLHVGIQKDNGPKAQQDDSDDDNSRQTERRGEGRKERERAEVRQRLHIEA